MTGRPVTPARRYRVVFTPAGWQVIDTREARDPVGEYGLGAAEHARAKAHAAELNAPLVCPKCGRPTTGSKHAALCGGFTSVPL